MGRGSGFAVVLTTLAAIGAGFARDASADEKGMCSAKYQSAQRLRAEGKLTLARADLLRCAEPACPAFVSNDCKTWLAEVDADLPSLVFAVLDANGGDVPNAIIRVDGADVAAATDGLGHAFDPGTHVVDASARGQTLRQQVVIRVGEKSRRIELRLATPPASVVESATASPASPPIAAYVLGGVGVAAIAVGSVFWIAGSNAAKTYNADCASMGCTSSQRDSAHRQLLIGDIAWGAGLAAGIGAVALVLSRGSGGATTTISLRPSSVSLTASF